jgi:hypothetical protein
MYEILTFAVGFGVLAVVAYAFYISGREKAERAAWFTISELRRELRASRIEIEGLRQVTGRPGPGPRVHPINFRAGL